MCIVCFSFKTKKQIQEFFKGLLSLLVFGLIVWELVKSHVRRYHSHVRGYLLDAEIDFLLIQYMCIFLVGTPVYLISFAN